jgi:hypothetical protein
VDVRAFYALVNGPWLSVVPIASSITHRLGLFIAPNWELNRFSGLILPLSHELTISSDAVDGSVRGPVAAWP